MFYGREVNFKRVGTYDTTNAASLPLGVAFAVYRFEFFVDYPAHVTPGEDERDPYAFGLEVPAVGVDEVKINLRIIYENKLGVRVFGIPNISDHRLEDFDANSSDEILIGMLDLVRPSDTSDVSNDQTKIVLAENTTLSESDIKRYGFYFKINISEINETSKAQALINCFERSEPYKAANWRFVSKKALIGKENISVDVFEKNNRRSYADTTRLVDASYRDGITVNGWWYKGGLQDVVDGDNNQYSKPDAWNLDKFDQPVMQAVYLFEEARALAQGKDNRLEGSKSAFDINSYWRERPQSSESYLSNSSDFSDPPWKRTGSYEATINTFDELPDNLHTLFTQGKASTCSLATIGSWLSWNFPERLIQICRSIFEQGSFYGTSSFIYPNPINIPDVFEIQCPIEMGHSIHHEYDDQIPSNQIRTKEFYIGVNFQSEMEFLWSSFWSSAFFAIKSLGSFDIRVFLNNYNEENDDVEMVRQIVNTSIGTANIIVAYIEDVGSGYFTEDKTDSTYGWEYAVSQSSPQKFVELINAWLSLQDGNTPLVWLECSLGRRPTKTSHLLFEGVLRHNESYKSRILTDDDYLPSGSKPMWVERFISSAVLSSSTFSPVRGKSGLPEHLDSEACRNQRLSDHVMLLVSEIQEVQHQTSSGVVKHFLFKVLTYGEYYTFFITEENFAENFIKAILVRGR